MRRFLYDTNVFVYALGREHPHRDACRRVVDLAAEGALRGEASVELVQEFLHVRARSTGDRAEAVREAEAVASLCALHEVTEADLHLALSLFARTERIEARDALHAATALNRGIDAILSTDGAFDLVAGLERVSPEVAEAALL